jgi:alpha-tubulin suppressor-like RCC1 family protein
VFDPPGTALDVVTAGGEHACGLELVNNNHGNAWCWGDNTKKQLGAPVAATSLDVPFPVAGNRVYKQMSAGRDHTCAVSQYKGADNVAGATPGTAVIQCWGLNGHGQLGNTLTTSSSTPVTALHPQQLFVPIP